MSWFNDLFGTGPAEQARTDVTATMTAAQDKARADMAAAQERARQAYATGQSYFEKGKEYYTPLQPGAQGAWQKYAELTGALPESTPGSVDAALRGQPGFQTAVDMSTEEAMRRAGASGMLGSGNMFQDIAGRTQALEKQNIGDYASRLLAMAGYAPQFAKSLSDITGQQAGFEGLQAGSETQYGGKLADLGMNTAKTIADAQANADLARTQAASNVWNAIMGVAGLGVNAISAFSGPKIPWVGAGGASGGAAYPTSGTKPVYGF